MPASPLSLLAVQTFFSNCKNPLQCSSSYAYSLPPLPPCSPQLKATELSQLRTQLQAAARKQTGSLAVRDLSDLVRPEQLVETENLTTLLVVVGKTNKGEWLQSYERLADFVVRAGRSGSGGACGPTWQH